MNTFLISVLVNILQAARRVKYYFVFRSLRHFTMMPSSVYVANLELCRHHKKIEGDIVECGTWKGGMIAGMVSVFGVTRKYFLFDSFEGLPPVKDIDGSDAQAWQSNKEGPDYFDNCKAMESDAADAMNISGAQNFTISKGWFSETLKNYSSIDGIAVLRLDADWYDSTMDCLVNLFPKINTGGVLILDDYYKWEGCSKAIHDYLSVNKLPYRIHSHKGICYLVKQ